jgi:alpha-galactosidase
MTPIKVAFIGAGSRSFGPAVIRDLLLSEALVDQGIELSLMDIVPEHLPENEQYAQWAMEKLDRKMVVTKTTSLQEALEGASFVIVGLEVDRYMYWSMDFHIPRKYGFKQVYGENGGPGSMFHALRNIGPVVEVARQMEKLCPDAWMLNFSNPEQRLCEAVNRLTSTRAVGLCHGVFMGQHQISEMLGIPRENLQTKACGLNHFTFFQEIKNKTTGEDLYPELARVESQASWATQWHELGLGRMLFRTFGLWPSPAANHYGEYVRWATEFMASELHYYYDAMEGKPWETGKIPEFVYTIDGFNTARPWQPEQQTLSTEHHEHKDKALRSSGELAIPIMEGILFDKQSELDAVIVENKGFIPNLPDGSAVEVPAYVGKNGITPMKMKPLPEAVAALMRTQCSIQQLLVEAFAERSRKKLLQTILLDPTVDSYRQAVEMMNEMITLQQALLPQFVD